MFGSKTYSYLSLHSLQRCASSEKVASVGSTGTPPSELIREYPTGHATSRYWSCPFRDHSPSMGVLVSPSPGHSNTPSWLSTAHDKSGHCNPTTGHISRSTTTVVLLAGSTHHQVSSASLRICSSSQGRHSSDLEAVRLSPTEPDTEISMSTLLLPLMHTTVCGLSAVCAAPVPRTKGWNFAGTSPSTTVHTSPARHTTICTTCGLRIGPEVEKATAWPIPSRSRTSMSMGSCPGMTPVTRFETWSEAGRVATLSP
mmetsp:Transcript_29284/g.72306  ORF Transcript_29284/g.72306 Transcript_29284/m.72306 type:complete len:256 (-) Transcript_29284:207-974(-)